MPTTEPTTEDVTTREVYAALAELRTEMLGEFDRLAERLESGGSISADLRSLNQPTPTRPDPFEVPGEVVEFRTGATWHYWLAAVMAFLVGVSVGTWL